MDSSAVGAATAPLASAGPWWSSLITWIVGIVILVAIVLACVIFVKTYGWPDWFSPQPITASLANGTSISIPISISSDAWASAVASQASGGSSSSTMSLPINIFIAKTTAYDDFLKLNAEMRTKINTANYPIDFVRAYWSAFVAAYIYSRYLGIDVSLAGNYPDVIEKFMQYHNGARTFQLWFVQTYSQLVNGTNQIFIVPTNGTIESEYQHEKEVGVDSTALTLPAGSYVIPPMITSINLAAITTSGK